MWRARPARTVAVSGLVLPVLVALLPPDPGRASAAPASAPATGAPAAAAIDPALRTTTDRTVDVVVRSRADQLGALASLVGDLGGRVTRTLPLVDSVAATLPRRAVEPLSRASEVLSISWDRPLQVQGGPAAASDAGSHQPSIRADEARASGLSGSGVTVALVDTGVADLPELAGRLVTVRDDRTGAPQPCQNFSGERGCGDSYGHGTFLAGLIAGGPAQSGGEPVGVAPGADILSVKVAGRDGATDVSTVLTAIQWVVSFRDRYGVDVLNLSLGTDSTQSYRVDPLNYAVERAWDAGIVVVVSASNLGPAAGTVSKPGDDPFVVTVGAVDSRGTAATEDDRLPDFSGRGPTADGISKPDVVAPGAHLTSLRSPGSLVEQSHPARGDGPYRRGSGTSMAAAVVSGVAALVIEARPGVTPDEVKHLLRAGARPVATPDAHAVGAGLVDAYDAARLAGPGRANSGVARSNGLGSLGASRGSLRFAVPSLLGALLGVGSTAQLLLWDPLGYTLRAWDAPTWHTSLHRLVAWQDVTWGGHNWGGHNWGGHNWGGSSWYGAWHGDRYGRPGPASAWYGAWD
jgi:serine protease AprX